jgi:hypothetical protein
VGAAFLRFKGQRLVRVSKQQHISTPNYNPTNNLRENKYCWNMKMLSFALAILEIP